MINSKNDSKSFNKANRMLDLISQEVYYTVGATEDGRPYGIFHDCI